MQSTLDATNDYELFEETFEALPFRGFSGGAIRYVSTLCDVPPHHDCGIAVDVRPRICTLIAHGTAPTAVLVSPVGLLLPLAVSQAGVGRLGRFAGPEDGFTM
jgi:hypothetical protein